MCLCSSKRANQNVFEKEGATAGNVFLLVAGLASCGSAAWVASDCLAAAKNAFAIYSVGVRGFSIEGDIEFEIQESRRTVLAALSTGKFELQHSLIEQSRAADLEAERLLNRIAAHCPSHRSCARRRVSLRLHGLSIWRSATRKPL